LREYITQALQGDREIELFSSWEGDWNKEPLERLDVTPEWFGGERFQIPERVAFRVKGRRAT
jgi:hypothetical protein